MCHFVTKRTFKKFHFVRSFDNLSMCESCKSCWTEFLLCYNGVIKHQIWHRWHCLVAHNLCCDVFCFPHFHVCATCHDSYFVGANHTNEQIVFCILLVFVVVVVVVVIVIISKGLPAEDNRSRRLFIFTTLRPKHGISRYVRSLIDLLIVKLIGEHILSVVSHSALMP